MDQNSRLIELLNRARAGDAPARDELFDKCRPYVNVVARAHVESWLRSKVDASDLVQQTLLEAHRGFQQFQGTTEAEWLAWLRQILSHNAIDFIRHFRGTEKRQVRREISMRVAAGNGSDEFFHEPPARQETPSELIMRQERELHLAEAISQLPPDYQEVIMLRNLQRLPFDEVARRMDRSRPAAQMLWMRAIRALQALVKTETDAR